MENRIYAGIRLLKTCTPVYTSLAWAKHPTIRKIALKVLPGISVFTATFTIHFFFPNTMLKKLLLLLLPGNGTIDFNEFVNMMININNNTLDEGELLEAFRTFDNDDKGYIFSSELRSVLRYIGDNIPDEEINDIVKDARHGYNRKITFEGNHTQ